MVLVRIFHRLTQPNPAHTTPAKDRNRDFPIVASRAHQVGRQNATESGYYDADRLLIDSDPEFGQFQHDLTEGRNGMDYPDVTTNHRAMTDDRLPA